MIHAIDWTQIISTISLLFVNGVLIQWVWKVNNRQYENLNNEFNRYKDDTGKRITKLENDLIESNNVAKSWFQKFYGASLIIERYRCSGKECKIYNEYVKLQNKEGDILQ